MLRDSSLFGRDDSSFRGSMQSNSHSTNSGYSTADEVSSQASDLSRPSAKSIYMQRRDYAACINKMMDKFQYRVEHLFTCMLDGKEVQTVGDCVDRLKLLESMGRVWGQDMLLEVRGGNLLLRDIEAKEVLDSLDLSSVLELQAVLDSGVFDSLLTVSVQDRRKKNTSVFMFQCNDLRADYVKKDLSRALSRKQKDSGPSSNLEIMAGLELIKNLGSASRPHELRAWKPPEEPPSRWSVPDTEEDLDEDQDDCPTPVQMPRDVDPPSPPRCSTVEEPPLHSAPPPPRPYRELDRDVDILNHICTDLEIFMGRIAAVVAKDGKRKRKKKNKVIEGMPPVEDFSTCLQKIKFGFNLLGKLNGKIKDPSPPEFVHCLFSTLKFVVTHCPDDLASTIVAPLLTPECIRLLSEEASTEEDQLWQSMGDPWNIPSTKWPEDDDDIPTYNVEFFDGWQPPELNGGSEASPPESPKESRPSINQGSAQRTPPPPRLSPRPDEPKPKSPRYMRVTYDFTARNQRELNITRGEVVELLDVTKQWWKVRNDRGAEGFVPNNVLEPLEKDSEEEQICDSSALTKRSKPAEVRAWLEHQGFSKITVRCLASLSGSALLGLSREELKAVCPEEGGRVFFRLQTLKTTAALSSLKLS